MDMVAASHVKQNFGEVLARAAQGPVGVERHRKLVAAIVPPQWLLQHQGVDERQAARAAQQQVELRRLLAHQQLGIALLCEAPQQQRKRIEAALREVERWEERQLCSADYIQRWRAWLAPSRQGTGATHVFGCRGLGPRHAAELSLYGSRPCRCRVNLESLFHLLEAARALCGHREYVVVGSLSVLGWRR